MLPGGTADVAANGLLFNTLAIFYMAFVGVCQTASQRVSFYIGAQDVAGVKLAVSTCVSITVFLAVVVSTILEIFGSDILHVYTHDESIISEGVKANLGMVLSIPPYALFMCYLGIMRASGQQMFATKVTWFAFYAIGIPFGFWLGVHGGVGLFDWTPSLLGIWIGNVTALSVSAILMSLKLFCTNWGEVVAVVEERKSKMEGNSSLSLSLTHDEEKAESDADRHSQWSLTGSVNTPSLALDGVPTLFTSCSYYDTTDYKDQVEIKM